MIGRLWFTPPSMLRYWEVLFFSFSVGLSRSAFWHVMEIFFLPLIAFSSIENETWSETPVEWLFFLRLWKFQARFSSPWRHSRPDSLATWASLTRHDRAASTLMTCRNCFARSLALSVTFSRQIMLLGSTKKTKTWKQEKNPKRKNCVKLVRRRRQKHRKKELKMSKWLRNRWARQESEGKRAQERKKKV